MNRESLVKFTELQTDYLHQAYEAGREGRELPPVPEWVRRDAEREYYRGQQITIHFRQLGVVVRSIDNPVNASRQFYE